MSNLPKGWEEVKLGDFCDILDNQRIPISSEKRAEIKGNIPYYGANGVQDYINDFIFNETLVLLAEDGGNFNDYQTRPIAYMIHGKSWVNNHTHVLRAKNGENYFLFYSLVHKDITSFINGGTRTKLNRGELVKIPIFVPPLEEQKKIADILSTVDKKIAFVEENINATEELKKGLMQKLLTEGIGHTEFKDSELGRIPESWESAKIGEVCKFSQGVQIPIEEQLTEKQENYIRFLRISDYTQNTTDIRYVPNSYNNSIISEEEIVMVRYGETAGFIGRGFEGVLANNLFTINPINKNLSKDFIYIFMKQPSMYNYLKNLRAAGAMPAVNFKSLSIIKLPIPSIEEQKQIAEILSTVDKKIENLKEKKLSFEELKKGLMQKLLTGEVRV